MRNSKQALKTSPFLFITFSVLIGLVTVFPGVTLAAIERDHLAAKLTFADAKHLLTRTGFGAHPTKLSQLVGLSREQAINDIIAGLNTTSQHPLPQWVEAPAPLYAIKADMPTEWRREFRKARNRELSNLRQWWVYEMIATTSPQTERLVLFWHNHFVSSYTAINQQSTSIARQNHMFRRLGSDNYRTFLKHVIRDPAMLDYLDNTSNRKGAPNENLARELLELFTLGEGHYTEQDIKNAARSLTGFTVSPSSNMQFRFHPWQHDFGNKELFGLKGPFDADDLINIILQQPRAALFLTEKFWAEYISRDTIDRSELRRIAKTFRQSGYDIKTLYRELISSPAFWDQANRATLIKSPVDLVIGMLRSTGKVPRSWQSLPVVLASLGQNLFEPPNVAGWPGHDTWVTPERLLARLDWFDRFDQSRFEKGARAIVASDSDMTDLSMNSMSMNSISMNAMSVTMSVNAMSVNTMSVDSMSMMSDSSAQSQSAARDSSSMMRASKGLEVNQPSVAVQATDVGASSLLAWRIAAEDYDGPAEYEIKLYGQGGLLWSSGAQILLGGHDTLRFGRISDLAELPWQQINQSIGIAAANVESVSISFLNDAAGDTGDRNLYVDWMKIDDVVFLASNGGQQSGCPPKEKFRSGALYCAGSLTIDRPSDVPGFRNVASASAGQSNGISTPSVTGAQSNTLTAAGVHLQWVRNPEVKRRDNVDIGFTLSNVVFEDRQWSTMVLRVVRGEGERLEMHLDSYACWPDCVERWPECSWTSEHDARHRTIVLDLPVTDNHCHFESLSIKDQRLVSALWQLMPQIFKAAAQSKKLERVKARKFYQAWSKQVNDLESQLAASRYMTQTRFELEIDGDFTDDFVIAKNFFDTAPLPNSRSFSDYASDVEVLQKQHRGLDLERLLMPGGPDLSSGGSNSVPPPSASSRGELASILANPVFQLK